MTDQGALFDVSSSGEPEVEMSAVLSSDGLYRYRLDRRWADGPALLFCMLNPSVADANVNDPTLLKCMKFARREGAAALTIVNLFAYRSPNPDDLRKADDPVGPENEAHIRRAFATHQHVIVGWGAWYLTQTARKGRKLKRLPVERIAADSGRKLLCLGTTKHGEPCHPLYLRDDTPVVPWRASGGG